MDRITFSQDAQAERVLKVLKALVALSGYASVADLYDLCKITTSYEDDNKGWTDLSEATITPFVGPAAKYSLNLPEPKLL